MRVYIDKLNNIDELIIRLLSDRDIKKIKDKRVLVKPNMLKPVARDKCLITDPDLVYAVVSFFKKAGACVVVGDNSIPTSSGNELMIAKECGFFDAAQGCFKNIGQEIFSMQLSNVESDFYISKEVIECDIMVSLPKFKTHDLTGLTLAIKNHFGIIPGGLKPFLHSLFPSINDFSRLLVNIYQIRPPDLVLVDCLNCVDARGRRFNPGNIIAGTNGHEVDYVCAGIAGVDPMLIPTIRIAYELAKFNTASIELVGEMPVLKQYQLPIGFPFRNAAVEFVGNLLYKLWLSRRPLINKTLCNKCHSCEQVCPRKSIRDFKINLKSCINCYCCIEVCPTDAIAKKFRFASLFHNFFTK